MATAGKSALTAPTGGPAGRPASASQSAGRFSSRILSAASNGLVFAPVRGTLLRARLTGPPPPYITSPAPAPRGRRGRWSGAVGGGAVSGIPLGCPSGFGRSAPALALASAVPDSA